MNERMNDAFIVYCYAPKALYNHVGGGGGDATAATGQQAHQLQVERSASHGVKQVYWDY